MGAQRLLARRVVVMLVITHDEFTDRAVDLLAEAQSGIIRFRDRAPSPVLFEDSQQMIVVSHRLQIDDQRLVAMNAQSRRREESPFGAMRQSVPQHTAR